MTRQVRHNLPPAPTPFVGRRRDRAQLRDRLTDPSCQLITLVGTGGIGKTRLAIELASECLDLFEDGAWFVDLQSVVQREHLLSAIAEALEIPNVGHEDLMGQVTNFLQDRTTLLILDNFEGLIAGADIVSTLIQTAPRLKILITSREMLNVRQEWVWTVSGLRYPDISNAEDAIEYGAIRLFAQHARRISPQFVLDDELDSVVRICQVVEGVPLALELAATWLRVLPCSVIADEIQASIDFLTTNLRDVPARHRSMRAVFDHSWQLLSDRERSVFARLSVFRGGVPRHAAETVAGASLMELSSLADKSLVWLGEGERYFIHQLLRQYAQEKLDESPQAAAEVRHAHALYYASYLAERARDMWSHRQRQATEEIAAEIDNIRHAWPVMLEVAPDSVMRAASYALGDYFQFCSRYVEAAERYEYAANVLRAKPESPSQAATYAEVLNSVGWFAIRLGHLDRAEEALVTARKLHEQYQIEPRLGQGTDPRIALGLLKAILGHYDESIALAEAALRDSIMRQDPANVSLCYYVLAGTALAQGEYEQARRHAHDAAEVSRHCGNQWFLAYSLNEQGNAERALGNYEAARRYYQQSYEIREAFNDPEGMAVALNHLGKIALLCEQYEEAVALFEKSLAGYRDINDRGGLTTSLEGLGTAFTALGRYEDARQQFMDALRVTLEAQIRPQTLSVLTGIAELLLATGNDSKGQELLGLVLQHSASDQETKMRAQQSLVAHHRRVEPAMLHSGARQGITAEILAVTESVQQALSLEHWLDQQDLAFPLQPSGQARQPANVLLDPLSDREIEILQLLAEGLTNQEIAERLTLVVGTVKAHNHHIFSKLGVRNRVEAITRARELDLL